MQSLPDYLNNTKQCESILDPDQNKVMDRMTDAIIRQRIQEYCTWDRQKRRRNECWPVVIEDTEITKIDKDNKGWYIETKSPSTLYIMNYSESKSFYDYCLFEGCKMDKQKGFLIEGIGVYFRWRKHIGRIEIDNAPNFESTCGLPEELNLLQLDCTCRHSRRLDVRNKIKVISIRGLEYLRDIEFLKISGNGCKNIIFFSKNELSDVIAPNGVKTYRAKNWVDYIKLREKLAEF